MEHQNPYQLRVKAKALAEEIRIIKQEEAKALRLARRLVKARAYVSEHHKPASHNELCQWEQAHRDQYTSLRDHRCGRAGNAALRMEARCTHLARGFLRGTPYIHIEGTRYDPPNWEKVFAMALKYGQGEGLRQDLTKWMMEGEERVVDYRRTPKPPRPKKVTEDDHGTMEVTL